MAIGVARPCIEAWLLSDGAALRLALILSRTPELPEEPESLPSNRRDPQHPKQVLAQIGASSQPQKDAVATRMNLQDARKRCPLSFEPFAVEVETHIRPLFS
jgi:hypothetical protein